MSITNAFILCIIFYPCIIAWLYYKKRFAENLLFGGLIVLGGVFASIAYKVDGDNGNTLSIIESIVVGYASVIAPTIFILVVLNVMTKDVKIK